MKAPFIPSLVVFLVAVSLTLTACQYPRGYGYVSSGPMAGTFIPYRYTGRSPLGDVTASALGSNRDHYYYVIRGANAGRRYYSARSVYSSRYGAAPAYQRSYYVHPYYSNSSHSNPYYGRSFSPANGLSYRPWGGGYGFCQPGQGSSLPYNWGLGLGLGSVWF